MIQNESPDVHEVVPKSDPLGNGLGYQGLKSGLVVEFDFSNTTQSDDPTYPHVSVQYRSDGPLSALHNYSLAFTYLSPRLLNSNVKK